MAVLPLLGAGAVGAAIASAAGRDVEKAPTLKEAVELAISKSQRPPANFRIPYELVTSSAPLDIPALEAQYGTAATAAIVAEKAARGNLGVEESAAIGPKYRDAYQKGAWNTLHANQDDREAYLTYKANQAADAGIGKYLEGIGGADLTTDKYHQFADKAAQIADLYDPSKRPISDYQEGNNQIYQQTLGRALSDAPTEGQVQMEGQLARNENALKQSTLQAALSSGATPAAAARAAAMASDNLMRGAAQEYAATGMRDRAINTQLASGMGTELEQNALSNYQGLRNQQLGALTTKQNYDMGLAGIGHNQTTDLGAMDIQRDQIRSNEKIAKNQQTAQMVSAGIGAAASLGGALFSDKNIKSNIKDMPASSLTAMLASVPAKSFNYKDAAPSEKGKWEGVLAQDMERAGFSDLVEDVDGVKALNVPKTLSMILAAQTDMARQLTKKGKTT